ncbi:MAG: carbon-nitrogen hydrolase family protein [Acidobacteria bacterium]|nr:carbon-nitrogen hydrolase family protein [Acidobacteriota bacterium]
MTQREITRRGFLTSAAIGATALAAGEGLSVSEAKAQAKPDQCEDSESLKVALLQMTSSIINPEASSPGKMVVMDADAVRQRQKANVQHADACCRQAAALGADIALFPEMWNIGYAGFDVKQKNARERWLELAVDNESAYIRHFTALARELNIAIAVTYLQKWNPAPRDTVSIISRSGEIVLTYAKVHTCDFTPTEASLTPGDDFPVCALDTRVGPVQVGCMICYDREFPESARILMLNNAEVILVPNACVIDQLRTDQLKTRAFENAVAVAMTNYASLPFDGNSLAYDSTGKSLVDPVSAGAEKIQIARINLHELREHRKKTIWGNAFRRPRKYKAIISEKVEPVFERKNFFGQPFDRETR